MKKSTIPRTLMLLLGCLFVAPSAVNWRGILTEAAVPSPQQSPLDCEKEELKTDLAPGTIANPKGVEIGEVKDFVLDLGTGRIAYTVGVFNQLGQSSDRVFVLPWEIVKVDLAMNTFTLSEEKTMLENAPNFALDTWPNVPTSQWAGIVTAYWQEKLGNNFAAATPPGQALSKASDLVGTTITDPAGEDLGTIEELLLDPETGAIAYAVLSSQDSKGSKHTVFFTLPWHLVQVNPTQHTFVLDMDEAVLAESRHVSRKRVDSNSSAEILEPDNARSREHQE